MEMSWGCEGGGADGKETLLLQLQKLCVFIGVDCCLMLFSQSDD